MPEAPEDEVPGGAVPEASEEHGDEEVSAGAPGARAVASEADVEVIAEPGGEADVPPLPEFAWGGGGVGDVEIRHEIEAQEAGGAAGDIGVSGEVGVDLEGEGGGAEEDGGAMDGGGLVDEVDEGGEVVGEGDFLEEAPSDEPDAFFDHGLGDAAGGGYLGEEVATSFDGAGDELGEEGDVGEEGEEVAGGGELTAKDIEGVAEGLEGIEGDADGEDDVKGWGIEGEAELAGEGGKGLDEEAEVFEETEDTEVAGEAEEEPGLASPGGGGVGDAEGGAVVKEAGDEEEGEEPPVPPRVEYVTGGHDEEVAWAKVVADHPIEEEEGAEEDEEGG